MRTRFGCGMLKWFSAPCGAPGSVTAKKNVLIRMLASLSHRCGGAEKRNLVGVALMEQAGVIVDSADACGAERDGGASSAARLTNAHAQRSHRRDAECSARAK